MENSWRPTSGTTPNTPHVSAPHVSTGCARMWSGSGPRAPHISATSPAQDPAHRRRRDAGGALGAGLNIASLTSARMVVAISSSVATPVSRA
jgi:hypothetical protein